MIHQNFHVKTKTEQLSMINRDLIKARHIQSHIKAMAAGGATPPGGSIWSPMNSAPYLVPITRWIE